jgi:hypothetical protein
MMELTILCSVRCGRILVDAPGIYCRVVTANNDYFVLPLEYLELHVIVPIKNRSDNRRSIQAQPESGLVKNSCFQSIL